MGQREGQEQEQERSVGKKGCETERQVPIPKTVARVRYAKNGKGLGAEALMKALLGGVEVRGALSAMGAPESHSTSKTRHRMTRYHPFLSSS